MNYQQEGQKETLQDLFPGLSPDQTSIMLDNSSGRVPVLWKYKLGRQTDGARFLLPTST